jgi:hypothetical protein
LLKNPLKLLLNHLQRLLQSTQRENKPRKVLIWMKNNLNKKIQEQEKFQRIQLLKKEKERKLKRKEVSLRFMLMVWVGPLVRNNLRICSLHMVRSLKQDCWEKKTANLEVLHLWNSHSNLLEQILWN